MGVMCMLDFKSISDVLSTISHKMIRETSDYKVTMVIILKGINQHKMTHSSAIILH